MNMKNLIPFLGILLNLNLFFAGAVTGREIRMAIENGDLAAIQGFIGAGVNFNMHITADSTPLIFAIDRDRVEIARAILAAPGIDINYPSRHGVLPISYAAQEGSDEIIRLLLADERCARNHMDDDDDGKTPLHIAVSERRTSTVQTLLEDPTVDRNIVSGSGSTALDYAIYSEHFDTAVLLINDPRVIKNRIDENGKTILHKINQLIICCELRRANKFMILDAILHVGGIDVNHQDHRGKTALHYAAAKWGDPDMILRLTAAGADSAIEDKSGHNAVYYAEQREPALAPSYLEALNSALGCSVVGLE